jgi:hypothetical protein
MAVMKQFYEGIVSGPTAIADAAAPPTSNADLLASVNALQKHMSNDVAKLEARLNDKAKTTLRSLLTPMPMLSTSDLL